MKNIILVYLGVVTFSFCIIVNSAMAQSTAFTYQGQLSAGGTLVTGKFDFLFSLYNASTNGGQIGTSQTNTTSVSNGLFMVTLDFGNGIFNGSNYWLGIAVRPNGGLGPFTSLNPLQAITPTPYSITASSSQSTRGITVDTNGFVAVGTTNISGVLHVVAPSGQVALAIGNSNPQVGPVQVVMDGWDVSTGANQWGILTPFGYPNGWECDGCLNAALLYWNGTALSFGSPDGGRPLFNVGIGTRTPQATLDVTSVAGGTVFLRNSSGVPTIQLRGTDIPGVAGRDTGAIDVYDGNGNANVTIDGRGVIGCSSLLTSQIYCSGVVTANSFAQTSDKNLKENFETFDNSRLLEKLSTLPILFWNFKNEPDTRHIGPMAQDFYAVFGIGRDDKHIATVDEEGVALAAIQALNQQLKEKESELGKLRVQNESLEKRLIELERKVNLLATKN
jgi:Chaperone of endosialidase